jgi:hypothetical protein
MNPYTIYTYCVFATINAKMLLLIIKIVLEISAISMNFCQNYRILRETAE